MKDAAVLFEKTQTRAIDLAVYQEANETFVAEHWCEGQFSLCDVERCFRVAEASITQSCDVLERRIAHRGVVAIDIKCAHLICG